MYGDRRAGRPQKGRGSMIDYEQDQREIEDYERECEDMGMEPIRFAGPGSALRAEGPGNPRNLSCPTCLEPNRLTPEDRAHGYQCDRCADIAEGKIIE